MNNSVQVRETGVLAIQAREEINMQITTAKNYPMHSTADQIKRFLDKAISLATSSIEVASACGYHLERKGKEGKVSIDGPSVRVAEIAANAYGNLRVVARIVEETEDHITAQAIVHDLENNLATSSEVRRGIRTSPTRGNYKFSQDMINMTANAACSIAKRNAIFDAIPKAFVNQIYDQAMEMVGGKNVSVPARFELACKKFEDMSIAPEQLLKKVGKASREELTAKDIMKLIGIYNAISDEQSSVEEEFAVKKEEAVADVPTETKKGKKQTPLQKYNALAVKVAQLRDMKYVENLVKAHEASFNKKFADFRDVELTRLNEDLEKSVENK